MEYDLTYRGTRLEIVGELRNNLRDHHPQDRRHRAQCAIDQLQAGLTRVRFGPVVYQVECAG
jgi:hypothetical protein